MQTYIHTYRNIYAHYMPIIIACLLHTLHMLSLIYFIIIKDILYFSFSFQLISYFASVSLICFVIRG